MLVIELREQPGYVKMHPKQKIYHTLVIVNLGFCTLAGWHKTVVLMAYSSLVSIEGSQKDINGEGKIPI